MERVVGERKKEIILIDRKAPQNLPANTLTLWSMFDLLVDRLLRKQLVRHSASLKHL
jgi:hypothetical protein